MADDKTVLGITETEISKTERAYGVLRGIFKGLKPDDITQVAEAFKTVGINLMKINPDNMDAVVKSLNKLGNEKLGTNAADNADKMVKSIDIMLQQEKIKNNSFVSAYLVRTEIELRMAKLAKEKVAAQEQGFMKMMEVRRKEGELLTAKWAKETFGADSKMTNSIIQSAGWIGLIIGILLLANETLKQFHERMQKSASALTTVGLMTDMTLAKYGQLAITVGSHLNTITHLGWTSAEAMKLWETASNNQITSLGMLEVRQAGASLSEQKGKELAVIKSMDMTFALNRMSVALFGSTQGTAKLIDISNKFGLAGVSNAHLLGGLIARTAGTAGIQASTMVELMDSMGDKTMYFKDGAISALGALTPLTLGLSKFNVNAKLSNYALNDMMKGMTSMVKGADSILYMALKGSGGMNFEQRLADAMNKNPMEKTMATMQMLQSKLGETGIYTSSLALKEFMPGMSEMARKNVLEFMTGSSYKNARAQLSKEKDEKGQAIIINEELKKQGKGLNDLAIAQLGGMNFEELAADYLKNILMVIVDGFAGIFGRLAIKGHSDNIDKIMDMSKQANNAPKLEGYKASGNT